MLQKIPRDRRALASSLCLGMVIGLMIIADPYLVNYLPAHSLRRFLLDVVPHGLSLCMLCVASACLMCVYHGGKIIDNREKIFIFMMVASYQVSGLFRGIGDPGNLIFLALLVWWVLTLFTAGNHTLVLTPFHLLNVCLLTIMILSAMNGGLVIVFAMPAVLKAMFVAFIMIDTVRRRELLSFCVKTLIIVTTLSAFIGIIQEVVFLYSGKILAHYKVKYLKLMLEQTALGTFLRVPAFTTMYLYLATALVSSLLLTFNILLYVGSSLNPRQRALTATAVALMLTALVLTFSKIAFLGLLVGVLVSVVLKWRSRIIHFAAVVLLVIVALYPLGGWHKVEVFLASATELPGDIGLRLELMKQGIEGFLSRQWLIGTGVGLGTKYTNHVMEWKAHNSFVLAADETGLAGLLVFTSLFVYVLVRLMTTMVVARERRDKAVVVGLIAGLLGYIVELQFSQNFLSYYNWFYLGLAESACIAIRSQVTGTQVVVARRLCDEMKGG